MKSGLKSTYYRRAYNRVLFIFQGVIEDAEDEDIVEDVRTYK